MTVANYISFIGNQCHSQDGEDFGLLLKSLNKIIISLLINLTLYPWTNIIEL